MLRPRRQAKQTLMPPPDVPEDVTRRARLITHLGVVIMSADAANGDLPQSFEWRTTAFELDDKIFQVSGELTARQGDTDGVPLQLMGSSGAREQNLLVDITEVKVGEAGQTLSVTLEQRSGNALGLEDAGGGEPDLDLTDFEPR